MISVLAACNDCARREWLGRVRPAIDVHALVSSATAAGSQSAISRACIASRHWPIATLLDC